MRFFILAVLLMVPSMLSHAQGEIGWRLTERGLTMVSACSADGKFVASVTTPAWRINDTPEAWFRSKIESNLFSWASGPVPKFKIYAEQSVLRSDVKFSNGEGQWQAFFYGVVRDGDRAQWGMVLVPPGLKETDLRVADGKAGLLELYTGDFTLYPENFSAPAPIPARPQGARNVSAGTLLSSQAMGVLDTGPTLAARRYELVKDGYVYNIEPSFGDYVAIGKWTKGAGGYNIIWAHGTEFVGDTCFRSAAPPKSVAKAKPGCRLVQTRVTTSSLQSVCAPSGGQCTLRSVPSTTTVMQEQCR